VATHFKRLSVTTPVPRTGSQILVGNHRGKSVEIRKCWEPPGTTVGNHRGKANSQPQNPTLASSNVTAFAAKLTDGPDWTVEDWASGAELVCSTCPPITSP
jgi:hypothetical protein